MKYACLRTDDLSPTLHCICCKVLGKAYAGILLLIYCEYTIAISIM